MSATEHFESATMSEVQPTIDGRAASAFANRRSPMSSDVAIVESFSEVIIPFSVEGTILGWNGAATELLGYTAEEMIGQPWHLLVSAADAKDIARAGQLLQAGEGSVRITSRLRRKDGKEIESLFLMSTVRDRTGQLTGFCGMFRDLGAEKIAERKIRS